METKNENNKANKKEEGGVPLIKDFDTIIGISEAMQGRPYYPEQRKAAAKQLAFEIADGMETEYADYVKLNSADGYSRGVVVYGELWAQLMQKEMAAGKTLEECADSTSHTADTDGITGFMYGAAVNALSKFWKHGEALRVWHNKQYNHEGAGVVNPAILTIKTEE